MKRDFLFSNFLERFPNDDICLEEIKKVKFPTGVYCITCFKITKHYRVKNRTAYSCAICRHQVYPLADTIFEKSTTSLRTWFYAMFLMTHTRAELSITQLQKELGVTYKTAWRIYKQLYALMQQNNSDLLTKPHENRLLQWTFFNKFEIKVVEKKEIIEK